MKNKHQLDSRRKLILAGAGVGVALISGCDTAPPATAQAPAQEESETLPAQGASMARTRKDYRVDAARHLYALNANRIYKGKLPAFLYAVGVLDVMIDRKGNVVSTSWSRAPEHAPAVMAEIVRTIEKASPLPVPARLGRTVYTDVWLWHKSGKFQLDSLSEGQA